MIQQKESIRIYLYLNVIDVVSVDVATDSSTVLGLIYDFQLILANLIVLYCGISEK